MNIRKIKLCMLGVLVCAILSVPVLGQQSMSPQQLTKALVNATEEECAECVNSLLDAGAQYNLDKEYSYNSSTTWRELIGRSGAKILQAYFDHGLDLRAAGAEKSTLLHYATNVESVKWLIAHGIQVDSRDIYGRTPLMCAARDGRLESVQGLLDEKANIGLHDNGGATAKWFAASGAKARDIFSVPLRPKFNEIVSLLETFGSMEYLENYLPSSEFDGELIDTRQSDVTGVFYRRLPFLPPDIRFFEVVKTIKREPLNDPNMKLFPAVGEHTALAATFFAVLPNKNVIKLGGVSDFAKLGLQIKSEAAALLLVQFLSSDDPVGNSKIVHYKGMDFVDLPLDLPKYTCLSVSLESSQKDRIKKPRVETMSSGSNEKSFVITRYMIPNTVNFGVGSSYSSSSVTRLVEHVASDGSYSSAIESIPVEFKMRNNCVYR
jgi:hypothetical protein